MVDLSLLIVDDDAHLLDGLRRTLRSLRSEVSAEFASDAESAIAAIERSRPDVMVTDLRMPKVDGVELLRRVEAKDPSIVRIVLSGEGGSALLTRAMGVAHRVVGKPCGAKELISICANAARFRREVFGLDVLRVVNGISRLPSPPKVYRWIEEAIAKEVALTEIGAIIEEDPALSAKVLQAANSAFFAARRAVSSTQQAVAMLGLETTKTLILAAGLHQTMRASNPQLERALESEWLHANRVAAIAQSIAVSTGLDRAMQAECYSAAIVHDIGRILILSCFRNQVADIERAMDVDGANPIDAERSVIGATHAQLGAHLLALWGLPDDVTEIVLRHEDTSQDPEGADSTKARIVVAADLIDEAQRGCPHATRRLSELNDGSPLKSLTELAREASLATSGRV